VSGERLISRGFTLAEVIVVVAIMGLVFGVSGLAFLSLQAPRSSKRVAALRHARAQAVLTGRPVDVGDHRSPLTAHALFLPDGRALGTGIDPLTGAPID